MRILMKCCILSLAFLLFFSVCIADTDTSKAPREAIHLTNAFQALPKFTPATLPLALTSDPVQSFYQADTSYIRGNLSGAVDQYMALIEQYPESEQARAADRRIDFLTKSCTETELDTMELGCPSKSELNTPLGKTVVAQFYFNRALRLMESDAVRAGEFVAKALTFAWDIMQEGHDDAYKSTILEAYLTASDITGQGDRVRSELSAFANSIDPNFTSWLIKSMVDGNEPSTDFVHSIEAQESILAHFIRMAKTSEDPEVSTKEFTKAFNFCKVMLEERLSSDPCISLAGTYLQAAKALGERQYAEAISDLETFVINEPLSIKRWIVRYELAFEYSKSENPSEIRILGVRHFNEVIREGDLALINPVINDLSISEEKRGLIMCFLGHAYIGVGRLVEADTHYDWVLDYYSKEAHAGDSALLGKVEVYARQSNTDAIEAAN